MKKVIEVTKRARVHISNSRGRLQNAGMRLQKGADPQKSWNRISGES